MSSPIPSKLDGQQVLQYAFDESSGELRVKASLTSTIIPPPGLEVSISAVDDNIAIRNSNNANELLINNDGSINVNTSGGSGSDVNLNQIGGVSPSVGNGTSDSGTLRVAIASDNSPLAVTGTFFQATQPISGTVTSNIGTTNGLALDSSLSTINTSVNTLLTDTQLRATPVPISGTVTSNAGTNLNTSLLALDSTVAKDSSLTTLNTSINTLLKPASTLTAVTTLGTITNALPSGTNVIGHVIVDSGSITANAGSNLNTSLLALDSTVAKDASLTTINTSINTLLKPANTLNAVTTLGTITNALPTGTNSIGQVTANAGSNLNTSLLALDSTVAKDSSITITNTKLTTINTTLGTPFQAGGSIGNTSFIANAGANLNTSSLALDTSVNGILISQGSSTSGEKGPIIQGAVTTSSPSYTTAQTNPLSLDTSGNLRISLKDTPANTNKFLVTADAITFASPQHTILDSGTLTTITNPVTVAQPTASNLNATVVGTGIFVTQATLAAETTKVIGTVNQGTSPWTVSGTVTANAGSNLNTSLLALESGGNLATISTNTSNTNTSVQNTQGSVAAGTVATKSNLIGGQYNTSVPVLTNAQQSAIQLNSSGSVKVDGSAVTQPISQNGYTNNISLSGSQSATINTTGMSSVLINISGTWTGTFNFQISIDGTNFFALSALDIVLLNNQAPLTTNTNGSFTFNVAGSTVFKLLNNTSITGTAVVQMGSSPDPSLSYGLLANTFVNQSGTWNVGLSAGSNLVGKVGIDQTTPGTTNKVALGSEVAQASTTSGQNGILSQTATTTSAPTYTTAKTNPLSTDVSGNLRISVKDSPANTNKFLVTADAITFASPQHVIVDTTPSTAVTNVGTFAVQATLAAETTKVIGTVNQGTSPWVVQDNATGSTAATAPIKAILNGGVFNTTPATITTGQMGQIQLDATQNLLTKINVALPTGSNVIGHVITDTGSTTVVTGTVAVTESGTWTVQPGNTPNTTPWLVDTTTSNGRTVIGKTGGLVTTAVTADQVILTYTVTAGKTFYLEYFDIAARLTTFVATATAFGTASLENPSGTKLYTQLIGGTGITAPPVGHDLSGNPFPIAAATVIRIVCTPLTTTSYTWQASFGGFEK